MASDVQFGCGRLAVGVQVGGDARVFDAGPVDQGVSLTLSLSLSLALSLSLSLVYPQGVLKSSVINLTAYYSLLWRAGAACFHAGSIG